MIAALCACGVGFLAGLLWEGRRLDLDAAAVERWRRVRDALGGDR